MINHSVQNGAVPYLILDAGALLFNKPVLPTSYLKSRKKQAEGIMQALQKMRYSAIGLSPLDLAAGVEFVKHLQDAYSVPFVSANLVDKKTGRKFFQPYITKKLDNLTIAIIGLTATAGRANGIQQNFTTLPWQEALSETFTEISGDADLIILLSSFPVQQNKQIARQFEQIDIILQSGTSTANMQPQRIQDTLIAQTASRGKYIGRLDINWLLPGHEEPVTQSQSTFNSTFVALRKSLPQDPEVKNIINKAKEQAFTANKQRLAKLRHETSRTNLLTSLVGSEKCKECHLRQYEAWQRTDHAMAWKTLATKKQQYNHDCLICHVTLPTYNRKKVEEIDLLTDLPTLFQNVSCESCHGPGRLHAGAPETDKLSRPKEKRCRICHTVQQDENFNFARKLELLQCTAEKRGEG